MRISRACGRWSRTARRATTLREARSAVAAEVVDPDVSVRVAGEAADAQGEAVLVEVRAQEVGAMVWGVQPGLHDRARRAKRPGAPGEVLAHPPATGVEVAGAPHRVGEVAAAGLVAEL